MQAQVESAVAALRAGELVAFATETVYGLGANAADAEAVRRVFELKGRPASHPLIVHLHSAQQLPLWARDISAAAHKLAAAFWPGPLTLVLPRAATVLDAVTGGQDTVALRVPAHPLARALLAAFAGGIAAPSANRYGRLSATCAAHVRAEFGDAVAVVLDGGDCDLGVESTIVSCDAQRVQLLRPGSITLSQLQAVVGPVSNGADAHSPRVPGSTLAHYSPRTPLQQVDPAQLAGLLAQRLAAGQRVGVLAQGPALWTHPELVWIDAGAQAVSYAHDLYANLRQLDQSGCAQLLVSRVPDDEAWDAVRDRLRRAATPSDLTA
jgi:L-threonylcarbamoyladenylate synthase